MRERPKLLENAKFRTITPRVLTYETRVSLLPIRKCIFQPRPKIVIDCSDDENDPEAVSDPKNDSGSSFVTSPVLQKRMKFMNPENAMNPDIMDEVPERFKRVRGKFVRSYYIKLYQLKPNRENK